MKRITKQEYSPEFRELAAKGGNVGLMVGTVAMELGLIEQALRNWVKAFDVGKFSGPGTR